jgi:hypothetical protein
MATKSAVPSHLKAENGGSADRHHGKTQSHVVCTAHFHLAFFFLRATKVAAAKQQIATEQGTTKAWQSDMAEHNRDHQQGTPFAQRSPAIHILVGPPARDNYTMPTFQLPAALSRWLSLEDTWRGLTSMLSPVVLHCAFPGYTATPSGSHD